MGCICCQIVVARGAQLDREASPTITLEVTAHDTPEGGITQRKTTVIVSILGRSARELKFRKYTVMH